MLNLAPPTIPAIKDTTDHLLDSEKLVSDVGLKVRFPRWANPTNSAPRPDIITLEWPLTQGGQGSEKPSSSASTQVWHSSVKLFLNAVRIGSGLRQTLE